MNITSNIKAFLYQFSLKKIPKMQVMLGYLVRESAKAAEELLEKPDSVSGSGFRVSSYESGSGFRVSVFEFRFSGSAFRVSWLVFGLPGPRERRSSGGAPREAAGGQGGGTMGPGLGFGV